jgi:hypothetical protein
MTNKEQIQLIVNKYNNIMNQMFPHTELINNSRLKNRAGEFMIDDPNGEGFKDVLEGCFHEQAEHFNPEIDVMIGYDFMDDELTKAETEQFIIIFDNFFNDLRRLNMHHPDIEEVDGSGNGLYYGALVLRTA